MKTLRSARDRKPSSWEMTAQGFQHSTPDVSARISPHRDGFTVITNLSVSHEKRGTGIGTDYMNRLGEAADAHGEPLVLGVLRPELKSWYNRLGYREVGEHPIMGTMMRREPRRS